MKNILFVYEDVSDLYKSFAEEFLLNTMKFLVLASIGVYIQQCLLIV